MIKFPDLIKVIIVDNETKNPISNIAIIIKLFANKKNDYTFIPPISNKGGIIEISRTWLDEEIEKTRNLFIMDYSSKLDDCKLKIEIKILNKEEVKRVTEYMLQWKDIEKISDIEIASLSKAINWKYEPISKIVEFSGQNMIDIELRIKKVNVNV